MSKEQKVGEAILESVGEVVVNGLSESLAEVEIGGKKVQLEQFGKPKIQDSTLRIPVVIGTIFEDYDLERMEKVDQAWLDKNKNMVLQKLVLRLNTSDNPYGGRMRGASIYFDAGDFKLEFLAGNIVRMTSTVICDLTSMLREVQELRWNLGSCISDIARKPRPGNGVKLAKY
jgi:hypothetical protein